VALKSIIDIDLRTSKFAEFHRLYQQYDKALKSAPAAWRLVQQNIDGSRESFGKMVDKMAAANVQMKLREKAQERADQITRTTADRWKDIARWSRETAGNIGRATTSLLRWASITGLISGLVGAGGLFGIERLALNAGGALRSATGRGTTVGGQAAFSGGLQSILENPDAFLSAIASAKYDVTQAPGLISAGLSPQQRAGDTTQAAIAVLRGLREESQRWTPAMFANMLRATRQEGFATPELLGTLRAMPADRFERMLAQIQTRRPGFELPPGVAERWQDFTTQMANAGHAIDTALIKGLVPLAPGLTKLSESVTKVINAFLGSSTLKTWLEEADKALEKFAGYIGTDEFQQNVRDFVAGIGRIASALGTGLSWITGSDPDLAREREERRQRVAKLRADRAGGRATAWSQLGDALTRTMTMDALMAEVRSRERSGDTSVSPKGAIGRHQVTPDTARTYGFDPNRLFEPAYNEKVARAIVADLARKYHGNVAEILAAYNAGPKGSEAFRTHGDDPRYLPRETQKYITGMEGAHVRIEDATGGNAVVSVNGLKQ